MENNAISKVFADVAVLLQAKGENVFKVRAHSKASDQIKSLPYPIADIADDTDRLRKIPGFGDAIVEKTQELVRTGRLRLLERLLEELPDGVLELVQIPGIGPKIAVTAAQQLGISTFEHLAASIESGEFQSLPRISKKGAQTILRHVNMRIDQGTRIGLGPATEMAATVISELEERCPQITHIQVAGSVRRAAELVGDINIVCAVKYDSDRATVVDAFTTLSNTHDISSHDESSATYTDRSGLVFSIKVVTDEAWTGALVYATGSVSHGTRLEELAKARGLVLSQDGLFEASESGESETPVVLHTEQDVYSRLGLGFVPPEMREDTGEIEVASDHDLSSIIMLKDIRGDLHSHTNWSDGRYPMEDMVAAAMTPEQGFEYLAITDHSPSATVANGLKPDMLLAHNNAVRELAESAGVRLLTGTEMDIKPDGSLDYSDELLADLDIVIASIHSGMDQDEATMTQRVIDAMESPHVDVICHLTARLTERRAPVMMDVGAILEAAVRTGTVMEINASPDRLDLNAEHVRLGVDMGVFFAVSTDSHRTWQFENMSYGVRTAIRGWVESNRVINAFHYAELMAFLTLPKSERYAFNDSRG
jgi:DNA polymerase (family 10)